MSNFKNIQIGDRVYDIRHGWGLIQFIFSCGDFKVNFTPADPDPFTVIYNNQGKEDICDISPTLFLTEPQIIGGDKNE